MTPADAPYVDGVLHRPVKCEHCGDTGDVRVHSHEDYGVSFESEHCGHCRYGKALIALDAAERELHEALAALDA